MGLVDFSRNPVFLITGAVLYFLGLMTHRETGPEYRLFTAPRWLWIICGAPLPGNRLCRLPTLLQLSGVAIALLQILAYIGAIAGTALLILFVGVLSSLFGARWLGIVRDETHPIGPIDWFRELLEKRNGIEVLRQDGVLRVEYPQTMVRPFGAGLLAICAFYARPLLAGASVRPGTPGGLAVLAATSLMFLLARTEHWEFTEDTISYSGPYWGRTITRWEDVILVDIVSENLRIKSLRGTSTVRSAGKGFSGLLMLIKTKVKPNQMCPWLGEMMDVVPDLPPCL